MIQRGFHFVKKKIKFGLDDSGFTLVELLISASILLVIMLAFSSYLYYQAKLNNTARNKQNMVNLESTIMNAAGNEDAIKQTERRMPTQ